MSNTRARRRSASEWFREKLLSCKPAHACVADRVGPDARLFGARKTSRALRERVIELVNLIVVTACCWQRAPPVAVIATTNLDLHTICIDLADERAGGRWWEALPDLTRRDDLTRVCGRGTRRARTCAGSRSARGHGARGLRRRNGARGARGSRDRRRARLCAGQRWARACASRRGADDHTARCANEYSAESCSQRPRCSCLFHERFLTGDRGAGHSIVCRIRSRSRQARS